MVPRQLSIGSRRIGPGNPCYVIAEAGVNHDGDLETARELVRQARSAGADCVKFQTFTASRLVTANAPKAAYQLEQTPPSESQLEMLRALELDRAALAELIALCRDEGIDFLSTPYGLEDIDLLESLDVPAYKVASAMLVEPPLLRRLAATGKPLILSTGMASLAEVDVAVRTLREAGHDAFALLQCTTNYPSELADTNLRVMRTLRAAFDCVVGYSDHTVGEVACLAATALGASILEKHFTLDRTRPGPDHASSVEPQDLLRLVRGVRDVEVALGSALKQPCPAELRNLTAMRRSLVTVRALSRGELITAESLTSKRPATGLPPRLLDEVVGRQALVDLAPDQILQWEHCGPRS